MWIILKGDPIEGFEVYGHFKTEEEALKRGSETFAVVESWWPVQVLDIDNDVELGYVCEKCGTSGECDDCNPDENSKIVPITSLGKPMPSDIMLDFSEIPDGI